MATKITSNISEGACVLTSRLDSITASTDQEVVTVRVVRDPEGVEDEFFSTTLYSYNGEVELYEVGRLIEDRFRVQGRTQDMMRVEIDDAAVEFTAIYCTHELPEDFDYSKCYWTTAATAVVHRGSLVSLSHWDDGSRTYHVKVVGVNADGTLGVVEKDFTRAATADHLSFSVEGIIEFGLNQTDEESGGDLVKVSYFAVSHGTLQKIFYVVDEPEYMVLGFRNLFNCQEYVDVSGKVKRKMAVEREVAICGNRAQHYNQVNNLTYEVETGPLTEDQAMTLEELITSHEVQLMGTATDSAALDILITDHTCERDNDDESLVTMKFTFRFASARPVLLPGDMRSLTPTITNIFSHEFTAEFA